MISHKYKCIFIHIPKCAGTSIEKKLELFDTYERGMQDHRAIRELEPFSIRQISDIWTDPKDGVYWVAKKFKSYCKSEKLVSRKEYNKYYKFTIIRNPWARLYSWYSNVMRDEVHKKEFGMVGECTLTKFVNNCMGQWALKSQLYWLTDHQGRIPMDSIIRFENLQNDFEKVANILRLQNSELPKLNIGKGPHYSDAFDDETRNRVAEIYRDEIALFNFKFGR